jgi:hypothetical protein
MNGQCLCGAVAFEFQGPATDIELCNCSRCQRATGSAFAAGFYVRKPDFRWRRGEELISIYDAPILNAPPAYRRCFCRVCGSMVPCVSAARPIVEIPAGLVQDRISSRPRYHMWMRSGAKWWNPTESAALPRYHDSPPASVRAALTGTLEPRD